MKYQCNSCGKVHDYRSDAVNCHPDINEIPDEQLESRLAAQQTRVPDVCPAGGKHSWHPLPGDNYLNYACKNCGARG